MGTCWIVDFAVPGDHEIKLKKKNEKKDKYLDLDRELKKKLWNMKATMIPVLIGAVSTINKGLLKRDWKTWKKGYPNYSIVKILELCREESWRPEESCCHSDSCEKPSAYSGVKNSQKKKNDNTRLDRTRYGKVICRELCEKYNYDHVTKCWLVGWLVGFWGISTPVGI